MASPRSTGTRYDLRGWSPTQAATRLRCSCRCIRCCRHVTFPVWTKNEHAFNKALS